MTSTKLPVVTPADAVKLGQQMRSNVKDVMTIAALSPTARIAATMGSVGGINAVGSVVAQAIAQRPDLTGPQIVAVILAYQARIAGKLRDKLQALDLATTDTKGNA